MKKYKITIAEKVNKIYKKLKYLDKETEKTLGKEFKGFADFDDDEGCHNLATRFIDNVSHSNFCKDIAGELNEEENWYLLKFKDKSHLLINMYNKEKYETALLKTKKQIKFTGKHGYLKEGV